MTTWNWSLTLIQVRTRHYPDWTGSAFHYEKLVNKCKFTGISMYNKIYWQNLYDCCTDNKMNKLIYLTQADLQYTTSTYLLGPHLPHWQSTIQRLKYLSDLRSPSCPSCKILQENPAFTDTYRSTTNESHRSISKPDQ